LAPAIDTRLVVEIGTALVLSLDDSIEALLDEPPNQPPPKLLVRNPQPASEASVTAKAKVETTTRKSIGPRSR
jgi:hypothetical protein